MLKPSTTLPTSKKLDHYFRQIVKIILSRQNPISGLFPASTAVNSHGDYTDAWVRDNVYTIQSVWGLAIAYRKAGCDNGRAYSLEQAVVKMMRGLLLVMMRQADKVEKFKRSRNPQDALHAKYDAASGDTVVADHEWGHLQLDATGIFILMLAQMIRSGLRIIFSIDEVHFVQNLVYYLAGAYRTPDYGIWERGHKINDGRAEINASSIGMVKAALEAIRGLNLYGDDNYQRAFIHVVGDEIAQLRITLESLLPRESNSKEVDAALLSVIGYPAFAVEDKELIKKTRDNVLSKLGGKYGCKRFLLDGHQTVLEDTSRLHYEASELKKFENIESEWPLFFTYLYIDALFSGDYVEAANYYNKLQNLTITKSALDLLPELYIVPADNVEAEKKQPGSQDRVANENIPLIWAQSLLYLGCLLEDGLLDIEDIDPLRRHTRIGRRHEIELQVALLAETAEVQRQLSTLGYPSDIFDDIEGISIRDSRELARVYSYIGANPKLQLSGRPMRRMRIQSTSQVYRIKEELVVFLPHFQSQAFYISLDNNLLVAQMAVELSYLVKYWQQSGRPLILIRINDKMLGAHDKQALLGFLNALQTDQVDSVNVILGNLNELVHNAGHENIKEIHNFSFLDSNKVKKAIDNDWLKFDENALEPLRNRDKTILQPFDDTDLLINTIQQSKNLYQQIDILETLAERNSLEFTIEFDTQTVVIKKLIEEVYRKACDLRLWSIIRKSAGLLDKYHDRLDVAAQEIVIRQKQLMVGRSYHSAVTISEILTSREIYNKIKEFSESDVREAQMVQEVLYYLGLLIKSTPSLFDGIITIRTGQLLLLCISEYADELGIDEDEAYDAFAALSPYEIQTRLKNLLGHYKKLVGKRTDLQALHYVKPDSDLVFVSFSEKDDPDTPDQITDWLDWRKQSGTILSMPEDFYKRLWELLASCSGIVIGDHYNYRNRIDTEYVQGAMTAEERSFALMVDHILNEIQAPEYRYLTIEAIMALSAFMQVNSGLHLNSHLILDHIIERAVHIDWAKHGSEQKQDIQDENLLSWKNFYRNPPHRIASAINMALEDLLLESGAENSSAKAM